MSGYDDVVTEDGSLVSITAKRPEQPFEVVTQMYGMIWYMATWIADEVGITQEEAIALAKDNFRQGLIDSPTRLYKSPNL